MSDSSRSSHSSDKEVVPSRSRSSSHSSVGKSSAHVARAMTDDGSVATFHKWHKFKIGGKFALTCCIAGTMGSFILGFNMGLLNSSVNYIAAELWPCDPMGEPGDWATMEISDACLTLMQTEPGVNISEKCNAGLSSDELEDAGCGDCIAPNAVSCDYASWMNTIVTTCVLIGAFIACMCGPALLKFTLWNLNLITMLIFIVGDISSVCAGNVGSMAWARLIVGFGVGCTSLGSPMYIAQMSPVTKKGTYGTAHQLIIDVGIFLAVLIGLAFGSGPFLTDMHWDSDKGEAGELVVDMELEQFDRIWWRVMMALGLIPVFISLGVFSKMKMQTPKEYIARGKYQDAKEGLYRIYKTDKFAEIEPFYNDIFAAIEGEHAARSSGLTFGKAMGMKQYRGMILIGCMCSAIQQLSGINVFVTASNQLFAQAGVEPSMVTTLSVIMTALNVIMTFPTLCLIEKMGRKSLMVMGIVGQCIGALLPTIGQWVDPDAAWSQYCSIIGVYILVCSFSVAMGPVLWVWFTEIFPPDVNNAASAALVASNWLTGIVMVFVGTSMGNKGLFTLFLILNVFSLVFMIIFCRETKGLPTGKSPYLMDKAEYKEFMDAKKVKK